MRRRAIAALALLAAISASACGTAANPSPPNVLWVVWDTVRSHDMSVYGYERPTTPFLDEWSLGARVFEDAISTAPTTVAAHASMFTGLLPFQHGADNQHASLPLDFVTVAERLRERGYATYLFSANPYLQEETLLSQGFDTIEHPWSPALRERAGLIARRKASFYAERGISRPILKGLIHPKTAGALARAGLEAWLDTLPRDTPWFAFLNYMEAHAPVVPLPEFRKRFMSAEQLESSFEAPPTGMQIWNYVAGVGEISRETLEITRLIYDAAVAELDDHFRQLVTSLTARGALRDDVVVLTSDHGELLGEHHMLNHQFAVHEELLRVPLIVHAPGRIEPGRDTRQVTNLDLFETVLELVGADTPEASRGVGVSLLDAPAQRPRLSEYPSASSVMRYVQLGHPEFDPQRFDRALRAFRAGRYKYVWASDGSHELYDLVDDPREERNVVHERADQAAALADELSAFLEALGPAAAPSEAAPISEEARQLLEGLGYALPSEAP